MFCCIRCSNYITETTVFQSERDNISKYVDFSKLNMPSWRDDYLSALNERDKKEKANEAIYDSCSSVENESHIDD